MKWRWLAAGVACGLALVVAWASSTQGSVANPVHEEGMLVRTAEVGDDPPVVELIALDSRQRGTILNGSWRHPLGDSNADIEGVPWPEALPLDRGSSLSVRLSTQVLPSLMTIQVYENTLTETGEPTGEPLSVIDCATDDMLSVGSCQLTASAEGLATQALEFDEACDLRIVANIHWFDVVNADAADPTVWATWLFSAETEDCLG